MARPKKDPVESAQQPTQPLTEQVSAPETVTPVQPPPPVFTPPPPPPVYVPPAPRQMRVEREGNSSAPYTRRFPQIRGGICEFCGVIDGRYSSQDQYKMCPHYRGMQARCTYCPENKDPDEVVRVSEMNVAEHPDKPGVLIMWCNSFECSKKHLDRFKQSV